MSFNIQNNLWLFKVLKKEIISHNPARFMYPSTWWWYFVVHRFIFTLPGWLLHLCCHQGPWPRCVRPAPAAEHGGTPACAWSCGAASPPAGHSSCQWWPCADFPHPLWFSAPCGSPCGSSHGAHPGAAARWSLRNLSFGPDLAAGELRALLDHSKEGKKEEKESKMIVELRERVVEEYESEEALWWMQKTAQLKK